MTTNNIPPRWYMITKDGLATLCADEEDARANAAGADLCFPALGPHVAVQLAPAQPAMPADEWLKEHEALMHRVSKAAIVVGYSGEGEAALSKAEHALLAHARRRIEGES